MVEKLITYLHILPNPDIPLPSSLPSITTSPQLTISVREHEQRALLIFEHILPALLDRFTVRSHAYTHARQEVVKGVCANFSDTMVSRLLGPVQKACMVT